MIIDYSATVVLEHLWLPSDSVWHNFQNLFEFDSKLSPTTSFKYRLWAFFKALVHVMIFFTMFIYLWCTLWFSLPCLFTFGARYDFLYHAYLTFENKSHPRDIRFALRHSVGDMSVKSTLMPSTYYLMALYIFSHNYFTLPECGIK